MSISQDNIFGTNDETEEMNINDSYLTTPFEECFKGVGSKDVISQKGHVDISLVSIQVMHIQDNIYESLGIGKSLPSLIF